MKPTRTITANRRKSSGLLTLFSGPSGTGKTMAARTLAAQLGKPIRFISTKGVKSRYIGETEKNLNRLLTSASKNQSILFFDEADALFGRRTKVTDSHDRYANQEVSYLLDLLQTYPGVVILATNQKSHLKKEARDRIPFAMQVMAPTNTTVLSSSPRSKK